VRHHRRAEDPDCEQDGLVPLEVPEAEAENDDKKSKGSK